MEEGLGGLGAGGVGGLGAGGVGGLGAGGLGVGVESLQDVPLTQVYKPPLNGEYRESHSNHVFRDES